MRIIIFLFTFKLFALSEDEIYSDTESLDYEEEDYDLSQKELEEDLQNSTTVRYQIAEVLQEKISLNNYLDLLNKPILCIGTGRNTHYIKQFPLQTYIRINDTSIDQTSRITPDLSGDAFDNNFVLTQDYSIVFFSHVGADKIIVNKNIINTLKKYYNCLLKNGLLIYCSSVLETKESFVDYETNWLKILNHVGFKNIIHFIKDESTRYDYPQAYSFIVIAHKENI